MNVRHAVLWGLLVLGGVACGPTQAGSGLEEQELTHVSQGACTIQDIPQPAPCNLPGLGTVQFVCDILTQNATCDAAANAYYGAVDQLANTQCNRNNSASWLASLQAAISTWTAARNNATSQEAAMCAQMHIDRYTQQSMMAAQAVAMADMQIACLHNTIAENQCNFAACLATPQCKPVLARGPGGAGAQCSDGSECQSGLCLAGTNTCARPPINYCCLAPTDNRCPTFQPNLNACMERIQRETNGYPYP